jgi:hypothetical protein
MMERAQGASIVCLFRSFSTDSKLTHSLAHSLTHALTPNDNDNDNRAYPPQQMQYYPMMGAPPGVQYYPVPAHQLYNPAGSQQMYNPGQQVQMYAPVGGAAPAQSNSNMFFKTRLCNKWRQGMCPFGDKCTYAHGQQELRRVAPEVLMQQQMLAAQQGLMQGEQQQQQQQQQRHAADQKSQVYYKTRLCIRFMQSGYCVKGNECTFAHGYDDLRLMKKKEDAPDEDVAEAGGDQRARERKNEELMSTEEGLTEEQRRARRGAEGAGAADALERKASPYADDADAI